MAAKGGREQGHYRQILYNLYANGDSYNFMNMETYEQMDLTKDQLGDDAKYLKEGLNIQINTYEGEVIGIELPEKIEYVVEKAEDADEVYVNEILPAKMEYNLKSVKEFGFFKDIGVLFKTVAAVL